MIMVVIKTRGGLGDFQSDKNNKMHYKFSMTLCSAKLPSLPSLAMHA